MAFFGQSVQVLSLVFILLSVVALWTGHAKSRRLGVSAGEKFTNAGYLLTMATTLALTVCVAIIIYSFFAGNFSLDYVARNHSDSDGVLGWLFRLSGLWGGRQGSLLFWAWLISLFNTWIAYRRMNVTDELSNMAISVSQLVLAAFMGVLVFSTSNNPFIAIDPSLLGDQGQLVGSAAYWGMNILLEHWAMAIHPPTLFIGYAGLTIPFAYAIAALIVNDSSKKWVELSTKVTVFSWFFLGIGIGLGAIWAYVVLGWGGYWAWDPVENASLLPWLVGVALIHSFTVYRKRGAFKRWAVMCACITLSFVILGTFITRSGVVESVHAFEGDPVSLVFFLALIIVSILAGIVGLIIRRDNFASDDEVTSLTSKDAAYYFNNAIMIVSAFMLAYLTLSSALPTWMPFGGQALSAGTYNAIARPLGILYCLILAVCPMLAWGKTHGKDFVRKIRVPALCALVLFAGLLVIFFTQLLPAYNDIIALGGTAAENLQADGPSWYYNGLSIVAFLVASLIFCNTLFLFIHGASSRARNKGESFFVALMNIFRKAPVQVGGYLAHLGVAVVLVGLVGSSMYVSETVAVIDYEQGATIDAEGYQLVFTGDTSEEMANGDAFVYTHFDVYDDSGKLIGSVQPGVHIVSSTQQQKLLAGTISLPMRDIFVVFQGMTEDGQLSMDVKINPLISWVWVGFGMMMVGAAVAFIAKRRFSADPAPSLPDTRGADDELAANDEGSNDEGDDTVRATTAEHVEK